MSLLLDAPHEPAVMEESSKNFDISTLCKLKLPKDASLWTNLDTDMRLNPRFQRLKEELRGVAEAEAQDQDTVQQAIDATVNDLTSCLYDVFAKDSLTSKLNFINTRRKPDGSSYGAPEALREARRTASRARVQYLNTLSDTTNKDALRLHKRKWNVATARC